MCVCVGMSVCVGGGVGVEGSLEVFGGGNEVTTVLLPHTIKLKSSLIIRTIKYIESYLIFSPLRAVQKRGDARLG